MSSLFTLLPDSHAICYYKGVYTQRKLYTRDSGVYAQHGNGFIRLLANGTSLPNVSLTELVTASNFATNSIGYLILLED